MTPSQSENGRARVGGSWKAFCGGCLVIALFVAGAHWLSPRLPGQAGEVFRRNVDENIEATALIYSESGDIRDYIDDREGRYR